MNLSALQSLYECRHLSQKQWTLWAVAMSKAWPEMYRGLSASAKHRCSACWAQWEDGVCPKCGDPVPFAPPPAIEVSPKLGEAMEANNDATGLEAEPCPFCGLENIFGHTSYFCTDEGEFAVLICEDCDCVGPRSDEPGDLRGAVDKWNSRALLAAPIAPAVEQEK